jgi:hypothetical protein
VFGRLVGDTICDDDGAIVGAAVVFGTEVCVLLVGLVVGKVIGIKVGDFVSCSQTVGGLLEILQMLWLIQSPKALTLVYTPGIAGFPHPSPNDTIPT